MRIAIVGTYNAGIDLVSAALNQLGVHFGQPYQENQLDTVPLAYRLRRWWNEPHLVASISAMARRSQLARWVQKLEESANVEESANLVAAAHPLLTLCLDDLKAAWGPNIRFLWCRRRSDQPHETSAVERTANWPELERMQATLNHALNSFFTTEPYFEIDVDQLFREPDRNLKKIAAFLEMQLPGQQERDVARWIESKRTPQKTHEVRPNSTAHSNHDVRPSKIVATILSGNSESLIEPAIQSVLEWVDEICLIDTGIRDNTVHIARIIAGEKFSLWTFPWCNDFAAARNSALQVADERQATWAMTLDTDERLEFPGFRDKGQLLQALESRSEVNAWMIPTRDGSYVKERFVRLPTGLRWQGRTHEALVGTTPAERKVLCGSLFWEAAKSAEDFGHKLQRDLCILLDEIEANPLTSRWWYYLGQTYEGMQQYRQAVQAFDQCIRLDDWADESSWACYLAARCLVSIKEYREAEEYCALGMSRKPNMAELPWLAGWCCFQRGAVAEAITWSQLAITLAQNSAARNEATFKYLAAWYEAPYDVLRYAYQRLDAPQLAQNAEFNFENSRAVRLKLYEG